MVVCKHFFVMFVKMEIVMVRSKHFLLIWYDQFYTRGDSK